jgi:hypothetical protein
LIDDLPCVSCSAGLIRGISASVRQSRYTIATSSSRKATGSQRAVTSGI